MSGERCLRRLPHLWDANRNGLMGLRKEMKKLEAPGVTVAAGKTAYATLRKKFPEDPELVKIVKCAYLEENECFVIKNECFRL